MGKNRYNKHMLEKLEFKTTKRTELVDLTQEIKERLGKNKLKEGVVHIYCPHTTAGITINENCDPSVQTDITAVLNRLIPFNSDYAHTEGNSDAHIKASIIGSSKTVFIHNRKLKLGTWQGIFFCEFDGPRRREIWLKFVEEPSS